MPQFLTRMETAGSSLGLYMTSPSANRRRIALRESEERYRSLIELSPYAIAIHQNGKFVYVNQAGVKLIGAREPGELVGRPVLDIVHPDSRETVIQRFRQIAGGEKVPLMEEKFIKLDGTPIDVEVAAIPFSYQGQPATQVVVRDITERKQAEMTLRESEEKYRNLVTEMTEGIFITDDKGRLIFANPALARIMGLEYPEQLMGRNFTEFIELSTVDEIAGYFREADGDRAVS